MIVLAMITVRVSDEEKEWLQYMADFYGTNLSELLKNYSIDQLEDEYDAQVAELAHKRWLEDDKQTVAMKDIIDEFGDLS
jgi:predicted transcriptional regulator